MAEKVSYRLFPKEKQEMTCIAPDCPLKVSRVSPEAANARPTKYPPRPHPSQGAGMISYFCDSGHENVFRDEGLIDLKPATRNVLMAFETAQQVIANSKKGSWPDLQSANRICEALHWLEEATGTRDAYAGWKKLSRLFKATLGRQRGHVALADGMQTVKLSIGEARKLTKCLQAWSVGRGISA